MPKEDKTRWQKSANIYFLLYGLVIIATYGYCKKAINKLNAITPLGEKDPINRSILGLLILGIICVILSVLMLFMGSSELSIYMGIVFIISISVVGLSVWAGKSGIWSDNTDTVKKQTIDIKNGLSVVTIMAIPAILIILEYYFDLYKCNSSSCKSRFGFEY